MSTGYSIRILLFAVLIQAAITSAWAAPLPSAAGVYVLAKKDVPVPIETLANQNVDGVALRYSWSVLEPSDGVYDWSSVDQDVESAHKYGKKVSLSVAAGIWTPAWVFDEGTESLSITWNKSWGPPPCSIQRVPVPWNNTYLSKWTAFIAAFGKRYAQNPTVASIKMTGLNTASEETNLPRTINYQKMHGFVSSCVKAESEDINSQWPQHGYSSQKVLDSWRVMLAAWMKAFPNQWLVLMITPDGFPTFGPEDNTSAIKMASSLVDESSHTLQDRFIVQSDSLSAKWNWTPASPGLLLGYQMLWNVTGDSNCRMNHLEKPCDPLQVLQTSLDRGIAAKAIFIEVYLVDVLNPAMQGILAKSHDQLSPHKR
jgi:hypothetical protein